MGDAIHVRLSEPGLVQVVLNGTPQPEDMFQAAADFREFMRHHPRPAVLVDVTKLSTISPSVRQASREAAKHLKVGPIVVVGASFHTRVILTLMIKASRLAKRETSMDLMFASSEAEGLAWLRAHMPPVSKP